MSNVIKLQRAVDRVRINHSLRDAQRIAVTLGSDVTDNPLEGRSGAHFVDEYQRGVEAGRAEAEARLREEYNDQLADERKRVEVLLTSIGDQVSHLFNRWEQEVIRLALTVARAVLKREVSIDKEVVLGQVREALRHLVGVEKVKLRVNPLDEELLRQRRAEMFSTADSLRDMIIEADDKIDPGGCIVESDSGNVDARLSTQLNRLEGLLFDQNQQETRP